MPVVKVGRIAGQFAKPRSEDTETRGGKTFTSYRGDSINGMEFDEATRTPDPDRLLQAYSQSAATLNLLRALAHGGFADLQNVHRWTLGFISGSPRGRTLRCIGRPHHRERWNSWPPAALRLKPCRICVAVDFYTSHEALMLCYEQCVHTALRAMANGSTLRRIFLWLGDRTRGIDDAHVEFARGIKNPLGLKCGPTMTADELLRLIDVLNPENKPGRLTLICRFGADKAAEKLPKLLSAVTREGAKRGLVVRSYARQHGQIGDRLQDAGLRARAPRGADLLRRPSSGRNTCRRHPSRIPPART